MFKKLNIEGLLAQFACHAPPTLDQLVTAAILSKGDEKPLSTFVEQVIINESQQQEDQAPGPSPFVYRFSESQASTLFLPKLAKPHNPCPVLTQGDILRPADPLSVGLELCVFIVDGLAIGELIAHTMGMANPRPRSPFHPARPATSDRQSQQGLGAHYQWERVSQVHFVKHGASDTVLIGTSVSIHLSGEL
ncbi:hypothetical protein O181_038685 [Austropuccinia psidii MF-1]|uniref:Uncharacterized protein n=1 Tax=Austropuccinia psidii MF-1 TaxID=1389203 RepID=A0A9Q3HED5_9BASI|nr:hypothetical protein [Austropuccinia psidii MF-1]